MISRLIFAFTAGTAAGLAIGYFIPRPVPPEAAQAQNQVATLEKELASKSAELKKLTEAAQGDASAKSKEASPVRTAAEMDAERQQWEEKQKRRKEKMQKRFAERLKLKVDERLAVMKQKLGLTEAQVESIRPMLEKHLTSTDMGLLMMSMESEEGLPPEQKKAKGQELFLTAINPAKSQESLDQQIASLLSPDQQAGYAAVKQEQRANGVEIAANKELSKLQAAMTLTPEQKDQAFGVFSQLANEDHDHPIPPIVAFASMTPGAGDAMEHEIGAEGVVQLKKLAEESQQRKLRRLEALKSILTPEQFNIYETQTKDKTADISEAMGEMGSLMIHGMEDEQPDEAVPAPAAPQPN